jgi:hypothetical protein
MRFLLVEGALSKEVVWPGVSWVPPVETVLLTLHLPWLVLAELKVVLALESHGSGAGVEAEKVLLYLFHRWDS